MDQIQEGFATLLTLGIITSSTDATITLDLKKLYALGYTLVLDSAEPVFITILDLNYVYNPIIFYGHVLPRTSLRSFVLSNIRSMGISSK